MTEVKSYACSYCGYSPTNRSTWCDLGCGRDYNQMIEVHPVLVRQFQKLIKEIEDLEYALRGLAANELGEAFGNDDGLCWCNPFYRGTGDWPGHDEACTWIRNLLQAHRINSPANLNT